MLYIQSLYVPGYDHKAPTNNHDRIGEAIKEHRKALELKPDYPEAHYRMAALYYRQGRMGDAIGEYRKALELKHDLPRIEELEDVMRRNPGKE